MKENLLKMVKVIVMCIVVVGIFAAAIVPTVLENKRTEETYAQAELLITSESYEEALVKLEEIKEKDIKDTYALINLCNAHAYYDNGNVSSAYYEINDVKFNHQTEEQLSKISIFKETLNTEYDEYLAKKAKEEDEACRAKIRSGVPFVGMSESEISNTSLGAPSSEVRHNSEMISGKVYTANLYDFKSGSITIFTARCVRGKVTQVWDKRDKLKSTSNPSTTKKKKDNEDDDPYNAKDYYDAEDFYDDCYDDFYDYEEAEEYYNEHGMWN